MKKSILLLISSLLGLSAVAIFYFFVNSFAIYLFFGIVLILLYFIATLYVEKEAAGDKEKIKNVGKILASALLVPLFLGSVWVVKHTQQPNSQAPYFNTTDYHAVFNRGVAFNQKLVLYNASTNPNEQGLWPTESGKMQAVASGSGVSLQFNRFFEPVFAQTSENKFSPIHLIYSQPIASGFGIKNTQSTLDCKTTPISEDSVRYSLTITSTDSEFLEDFGEKAPYQDVVELTDGIIKKGKSLYSIFIENPHFRSKNIKSKQILEGILLQMGSCYLLRDFKASEEGNLVFFPSKTLFDNQFKCTINGVAAQPALNTTVSLALNQPFFVGFYNSSQKRFFDVTDASVQASRALAMYFDHPSGYVLSAQAKRPQVGTRQVRFLHNHYEQLLAQNLKEGFLFGSNYRKANANFFAGNLFYTIDKPAVKPLIELTDVFSGNPSAAQVTDTFALQSQDNTLLWLFQLKDFSANGFSFQRNLLFLTFLFLSFLFTVLYNSDYRFNRIEPVIYSVLYLFLTFRFILLWRVATFPPLENSTKQELDTLLHFDYSFFGLSLPLPLTFLLPIAFLIGLNVYRWKWKGHELATKLTTLRYKKYSTNWSITGLYAGLLVLCLVVFLIAKSSPSLDILRRIFGIFVPIILYIIFTQKVIETSEYSIFKTKKSLPNWINYAREWMHHWNETPNFYITLLTLGYFGWVDSGFGVLFLLFLILKNTLFSFLRKPHSDTEVSLKEMFLQPRNYWVFGIFFLSIYLLFISYKPLFYQAFHYRTVVVIGLLLLVAGYSFFTKHSRRNTILGVCSVLILLFVIPFTNQWLNGIIENKVKHVVHRAAIIFQPVDELITSKQYDSFSERRIIEAAENQWFINSYLSKTTDVHRAIDLQPHFNKGVGYTTQTRDVVVPRYIISEFGSFTLLCLLILLALPTLIYMLSFLFYDKNRIGVLSSKSYIGGVSLLLFFTIGFFVWLSSTNRFVFFGQDFPFLSLTSKLSLLLPLTLLFLPFFTKPQRRSIESISLSVNSTRYGIFILIVVVFVVASGRSNQLKESNFQISLETTEYTINQELNAILEAIQKNTEIRTDDAQLLANQPVKMPKGLSKLLSTLVASDEYKQLLEKSDSYTRSVLEILAKNPSLAFRAESPIYIRFDDGQYEALYNRHLYLELSPYSSENTWKGNVYQHGADSLTNSVLRINQATYLVGQSPTFYGSGTFSLAALPASWFRQQTDPLVLLNIRNQPNQKSASLQLIANAQQQTYQQRIGDFVNVLQGNELAHVLDGEQSLLVSLAKQTNWSFMTNYWVNGKQRMVYPLGEKLFWAYHYANAVRPTYTTDSLLLADVPVSLDYELSRTAQALIDSICKTKYPKPNFKLGVIAADGDGNIRMISDFANNRKHIDPNDEQGIEALQRNYFFFSNSKNERDQWGNTNLLHLSLGPGSSIKPLVLSAVASQVNAGWEKLILKGIDPALVEIKDNESYVHEYAGFKLKKGWVIEPGDAASDFNTVRYLAKSSNFYHSLLLFLGSYTKEDFRGTTGYDIRNVLAFGKNKFPIVQVGDRTYSLPSYKDKWPRSSKSENTFFGNEKSVLAKGLSNNLGLIVEDINKTDYTIKELDRVNYADSLLYNKYNRHQLSSFLWSFPEQSYFIQAERKHGNPLTNFNDGLKNPTLGGKPYSITPLKMAEMYGKLFTQNQAYHLHISHKAITETNWEVDSTWQNTYDNFLKTNVIEGMKQVLSGAEGTARGLFGGSNRYKDYYCYAKTGTINESTRTSNSKRFVLIISKNDIQQAGFKNNKLYVVYFTANQMGKEQDWALYRAILDKITASNSFKNYMK